MRHLLGLAVLSLVACHERVQLLGTDTTLVEDCVLCVDDANCLPVADGTACSTGTCEGGACAAPPEGQAVSFIAAGEHNTCAIAASKELFCWGDNTRGQVGVGNTDPQPLPVRVDGGPWAEVTVGQYHVCGLKPDGSLWCWGGNARGQLGVDQSGDKHIPQRVDSDVVQWSSVLAGGKHTCALTANAQLYCWGRGTEGQLGTGEDIDYRAPAAVDVGSLALRSLGLGRDHSCAITSRSELWCWGENISGQLGVGDQGQRGVPSRVELGEDADSVTAAGSHSCALSTSGDALCFGRNSDGQLGLGDVGSGQHEAPQRLNYALSFDSLEASSRHSCGLEGGLLWCWGSGEFGQLGLGDTEPTPSPRKVEVAEDWRSIAGGHSHMCGLRSDGTLYCWGSNAVGQLGVGANVESTALPTRIVLP